MRFCSLSPTNQLAKDGLHEATLGLTELNIEEKEKELAEFRNRVQEYIWQSKLPASRFRRARYQALQDYRPRGRRDLRGPHGPVGN